jgi:hypothetical protein
MSTGNFALFAPDTAIFPVNSRLSPPFPVCDPSKFPVVRKKRAPNSADKVLIDLAFLRMRSADYLSEDDFCGNFTVKAGISLPIPSAGARP